MYTVSVTIDLMWTGQCKCFARSIGPAGVREFENVLYRKFLANGLGEQSISDFIGVMASSNW